MEVGGEVKRQLLFGGRRRSRVIHESFKSVFSQENLALNYISNSSISLHIYLNLVDTKAKTATTEHVEHVQLMQKYKKRS